MPLLSHVPKGHIHKAWILQNLPTSSLLACPPLEAEASSGCLTEGVLPKGATSPSFIFVSFFIFIRMMKLRMLNQDATTSWGQKLPKAKPAARS